MIDLTSSLYLGLGHPSGALRPWRALTLGRPAALEIDGAAARLEHEVARLLGSEAAALARSTTHVFVDVMTFTRAGGPILVDGAAYPVLRWGAERAAGAGVPACSFARGDLGDLARRLSDHPPGAVILTDGICPDCGSAPPLREYAALAQRFGARLVVDDSQGIGILGRGATPERPWGTGGGGTASWLDLAGAPALTVVASLAKALGAPVATIAGSGDTISCWLRASQTRVHTSPPTAADLAALEAALAINRARGDRLRARLLANIDRFRAVLASAGLAPRGGTLPIQSLAVSSVEAARRLRARLADAGVLCVAQSPVSGSARVTFVVTARHSLEAVTAAAEVIARHAAAAARYERECPRCQPAEAWRTAA